MIASLIPLLIGFLVKYIISKHEIACHISALTITGSGRIIAILRANVSSNNISM